MGITAELEKTRCVACDSNGVASLGEEVVEYVIGERDFIACWSVERASGVVMVVVVDVQDTL